MVTVNKKSVQQAVASKGPRGSRPYQRWTVIGLFAILLVSLALVFTLMNSGSKQASSSDGATTTTTAHQNNNAADNQQQNQRQAQQSDTAGASSNADTEQEKTIKDIVAARVHLVDLEFEEASDEGEKSNEEEEGEDERPTPTAYGYFCRVAWDQYKANPSATPMYHNLIDASPDCAHPRRVPMSAVMDAIIANDSVHLQGRKAWSSDVPKVLEMNAVIFHQSRCGSTVVANMLASMTGTAETDGEEGGSHRVYSEASPPFQAMSYCGDQFQHCSKHFAMKTLREVMYLMMRTDNPNEEKVFFKFQSIASLYIPLWLSVYPHTPWLYVFRDPTHVMMSHFAKGAASSQVCLRQKDNPGTALRELVERHASKEENDLSSDIATWESPEDICAAHLASLTETAAAHLNDFAIPINYEDIPLRFYDEIVPHRLDLKISQKIVDRIIAESKSYSKQTKKTGDFVSDKEAKEKAATDKIKAATATFLQESFEQLQDAADVQKIEAAMLLPASSNVYD